MQKKSKKIIFVLCVVLVLLVGVLVLSMKLCASNNKSKTTNYGTNQKLSGTTITSGGNYDVEGDYSTITINTSEAVQLNLKGANITSDNGPAINVVKAKEVSITVSGDNTITSTTTTDLDGAIYSKADLYLSGDGTLTIKSNIDGIVSKDSLVIESGTYIINSEDDGIRGKDSVLINNGTFTITSGGNAIKSTNDTDASLGYITIENGTFDINSSRDGIQAETKLVINDGKFTIKTSGDNSEESYKGIKAGTNIEVNGGEFNLNTSDDSVHSNGNVTVNKGTFTIKSDDDGIHGDGLVEINDGTMDITASEGIEGTFVKINGGTIKISASDDGINAASKSTDYSVTVEINGGDITINMGQGDTDGIDSNGNLYINGGTVNITGQSAFDYDGEAKYTGGKMIVNGVETTTITNQMMGGGMMGGGPGGMQGGQAPNGNMRGRMR